MVDAVTPDPDRRPDRRTILAGGTAGTAGILTLVLPPASAAATGAAPAAIAAEKPADVTAVPIGYVSGGSTGGIRVTWTGVSIAAGYELRWSTTAGDYSTTTTSSGTGTTADLTGLPGTDTTHHLVVVAIDSLGNASVPSDPVASSPVIATGGTASTVDVDGSVAFVVHTFTADGTFTLNRARDVDHLIVAGGGGGGAHVGGGGGGGGVLAGTATLAGTLSVTVGAGGTGASHPGAGNNASAIRAQSGGDSMLGPSLVATGGGSGGSWTYHLGRSGGSGGGGSGASAGGVGGAGEGTVGQGYAGGAGLGSVTNGYPTGGGGGAGGPGSDWTAERSGDGGIGRPSTITGTLVRYGGGGGGGVHGSTEPPAATDAAAGTGADGGGDGARQQVSLQVEQHGADGRGGGGGGGGNFNSVPSYGGNGGSGIVVVRYALVDAPAPATPTGVTAEGAGYDDGGDTSITGGIEVSWDQVATATSYIVAYRPADGDTWTTIEVHGLTTTVVRDLDATLSYEVTVAAASAGLTSAPSTAVTSGTVIATGGTVTTFTADGSNGPAGTTYVVHSFTAVGTATFTLARSIDVEHLVVAGGASGTRGTCSVYYGHGGGGGGVSAGTLNSPATGGYSVVVGAGGPGATQSCFAAHRGADGQDSRLVRSSDATVLVTATGGRGAVGNGTFDGVTASAVGGASGTGTFAGTAYTANAGGTGTGSYPAGGGGGAGAPGSGIDGGAGRTSTITGSAVGYGGGGAGRNSVGFGTATDGGSIGSDATAGRGGGGSDGGTGYTSGGSGVVILRYALPA